MSDSANSENKQLVSASGDVLSPDAETGRSVERRLENDKYVSVILKRTDETFRHPDDILEKAIKEGLEQHERPIVSLLLSALAAGMILCFTAMAVAVMVTVVDDPQHGVGRVALASVYPLGFVLCILSRVQLFTEHTATAVYPVLDGKAQVKSLLKLWGIVVLGNLFGGLFSAGMLATVDTVIKAGEGYLFLANHILSFPVQTLFFSAVMAGWLMALGAWIVLATASTASQMISIYMVTFVIGLAGLHHSIAGSLELFAAYFSSDNVTFSQLPVPIVTILAGNLVGGSVFVAVLNYGHIRHSQRLERRKQAR